ncbi:MAG TPA: bifunctional oligoribonuclease/PAP phosphatase NrnA [Anaerolineales bacterium]|nr:bifunctional oligoribonuclease/PAP phosphatase NrnA [Anaerolineales bacterium]
MDAEIERARALLEGAHEIVLVSHERPDGDAVGSLLGLTLSLRRRGQSATAVLGAPLPSRYGFLPGASEVRPTIPAETDLLVAVDCADLGRTGIPAGELRLPAGINIDHHPTNTRFAQVNLIDPQAAATAQILYELSPALGLPVDRAIATNYLAGLVSDTIGFRTPNVTPAVLRLAAEMESQTGSLAEVYAQLLDRRSFSAARYWGAGLARLERQGPVVWTQLTLEDRMAAGYSGTDDADLINLLGTVEGSEVSLVFVEQSGGQVKVSWRSRNGLDVSRLAQQFGGGGHEPAAGASVSGAMDDVVRRVVDATLAALSATGPGAA